MVLVVVLAIGVISVMFICQLALALKEPAPWVYAILAMIPCISTIAILILNGRATSALKAQGIRVGLMGARKEDLDKINANTAITPGGSHTVALKNAVPSTDEGDAEAQFNLGWMYDNGLGVAKDEVEAYKWFLLSGVQGNGSAKRYIALIEKRLTPEQRAEGQKRFREFKKK